MEYEQMMENTKILFKQMFGESLFNRLSNRKLKVLKFEGDDITTSKVLATFPSIKERFNKKWIDYFKERHENWLEMFIQVPYHYGIQVGIELSKDDNKFYIDEIRELRKEINELKYGLRESDEE